LGSVKYTTSFLGTTSLKNINKNVRNQINYYNNDKKRPVMIRKLDYSENYTQAIQLKGHFEDSIKRIKNSSMIINMHSNIRLDIVLSINLDIRKNIKVKIDRIHTYYLGIFTIIC